MTRGESHEPPEGASDETVAAVGTVSEALEWVERARGRLYDLHQMIGHADFLLDEAAGALEQAGHAEEARLIRQEVIGRNVLPGRWTFQIVEEFEDTYYRPFAEIDTTIRERLMAGRKHVYESELKERRRTPGRPGHESRPDDVG